MSFQPATCVLLICDGDDPCNPWDDEDGELHFDTEAQATEWARNNGWTVTGPAARCPTCTARAVCAATGHTWGTWQPGNVDGLPFRRRTCDHCRDSEYDPPFGEIGERLAAVREAERIVATAAQAGGAA